MICMWKPSIGFNTLLCQMTYIVKEKGAEPFQTITRNVQIELKLLGNFKNRLFQLLISDLLITKVM